MRGAILSTADVARRQGAHHRRRRRTGRFHRCGRRGDRACRAAAQVDRPRRCRPGGHRGLRRPAARLSSRSAMAASAASTTPARSAASPSHPRGCVWQSRAMKASRCGGPVPRPSRRNCLEGCSYRRHLLAGRAQPGHRHAGKRTAWLAARRRPRHAHDRLSGQAALAVMVGQGALPRVVRGECRDPVAVPPQGRADGPPAAAARRARGAGHPRRLPSERGNGGGRLSRRHDPGGAHLPMRTRRCCAVPAAGQCRRSPGTSAASASPSALRKAPPASSISPADAPGVHVRQAECILRGQRRRRQNPPLGNGPSLVFATLRDSFAAIGHG